MLGMARLENDRYALLLYEEDGKSFGYLVDLAGSKQGPYWCTENGNNLSPGYSVKEFKRGEEKGWPSVPQV
jgi:hypothetical protein